MKKYEHLCVVIVKNDKVFCCKSKTFPDKWAFPYAETPMVFYTGEEYKKLLSEIVSGDCKEDFVWSEQYEDESSEMILNVISCCSDSGKFHLCQNCDTQWLGKDELDSVGWDPLFTECIEDIKGVLAESKYTVSVEYSDGTHDIVWQGICSKIEAHRAFKKAVKAQIDKYQKDKKKCLVCIYDEHHNIIRHETFH